MKARTLALATVVTALAACSQAQRSPAPSAETQEAKGSNRAYGTASAPYGGMDGPAAEAPPAVAPAAAAAVDAPSYGSRPAATSDGFGDGHGRLGGGARRMESASGGGGPIRAGEWDDNANYREFQRYLGTVSDPIRRLDVRSRRFMVVRDAQGKAVPGCSVTVRDGKQHEVTLTTTASGRAILFPNAEGLEGRDFQATARCSAESATRTFSMNDDGDGTVDLRLRGTRQLSRVRPVDLAFVLDTTGSMSEEIASVKATIQKVAATLQTREVAVRVGLVEYKDRGDTFVTRVYPMSSDLSDFSRRVAGIQAGGGGDTPENMSAGLHAALGELDWNPQAVTRAAFVIGDAPPHLDYPNEADYAVDMRTAAHRGIQLFTIAASGMDGLGQAVWRQMAAYTGATNMFVLRGGAGPQSVGGGDPKSSCGGTQTNYASGNLDQLIVRKIEGELRALDADPMRIPGLVTDEDAKPCDQRISLWQ